ncbi:MAG TPA: histidine phosphatase family protein [Steroidobacteraceae bacterium]|jgi:phosphohistidine phosphatase
MKQLTLLLMRHAEAETATAGDPDIDRALSARGRTEAIDAADCIAGANLRVELMLVSPARRTRETALILAAALDMADEFQIEPTLYPGETETLLERVQRCDSEAARTVLMVGHNPAMSALAQRLGGNGRPMELPPAGLCRLEFENDCWSQVRAATALAVTRLR